MQDVVLILKTHLMNKPRQNNMCSSPNLQHIILIDYNEESLNLMNINILKDNIKQKIKSTHMSY